MRGEKKHHKKGIAIFLSIILVMVTVTSQMGGLVLASSSASLSEYDIEESETGSEPVGEETLTETEGITETEMLTETEIVPETVPETEIVPETVVAAETETAVETMAELPEKPQPRAAVDRSNEFKLQSFSLKVDSTQVCTEDGPVFTGNTPEFDITYGKVRLNIALTFDQIDDSKDNVKEDDYLIFTICTVSGTLATEWSNLTTNQPIYNATGSVQYAAGTLYVEGNQLKLRIVFTDQIEGRNHIVGKVSAGSDLNSSTGEGNLSIQRNGETIAEIIKKQKGTNNRITRLPYKDYPGTYKTNTSHTTDTIKWTMELNDYVEEQFYNTTPLGDLIIEEAIDYHQSFDTDSNCKKGVSLQVYAPIYMMPGAGDTNKGSGKVYTHGMSGFAEFARLNSARTLDDMEWRDTEAEVRSTAKTWTIVTETDPDNSGKTRERLVINMGSPTAGTGYRFSEVMKDPNYSLAQLLYELQTAADYCKVIVDANTSQNDYYQVNGFSMKVWRASYAAYIASYNYYKNDPCVYNYKLVMNTKVQTTQDGTRTIDHVYNTFTASRNGTVADETAAQENFWSSVIEAKAVKGDVQIFKADALYGNTAGSKADDKAIAGAMQDVEFEVYQADGTGPLTFTYTLGKYVYDAGGSETRIKIDRADGSAIIADLDKGATPEAYYLKEVSAPSGYYSGQNQRFNFSVASNTVSYQLVNNEPRRVKLTKTKSGDSSVRLKNAAFKLYRYTLSDLSDASEMTGFTARVINGVRYYVYDGSGSASLATGTDGSLQVTCLPAGKYFFKEVTAPPGYRLSDQLRRFAVTETLPAGTQALVDTGDFENEPDKISTRVRIHKRDEAGNALAGASLVLLDESGNTIRTWTSGYNGYYLEGVLEAGKTYVLQERKAPSGYLKAADITFQAPADTTVMDVVMTDVKRATDYQIKVTKYVKYEDAYRALSYSFYAALFWDEACTQRASEVKELKLEKAYSTSAVFKKLAVGTYYLAETDEEGNALDGSQDAVPFTNEITNQKLELSVNKTTAEAVIVNHIKPAMQGYLIKNDGSITVNKTVKGGIKEEAVTDVFYFTIYADRDQTMAVATKELSLVDCSSGVVQFTDLPYGIYYIAETDAEGIPVDASYDYEVTVDQSEIALSEEAASAQVTIINNMGKSELQLIKEIDKSQTKADDLLTYTLSIKHVGDAKQIKDIEIKDYIPQYTHYVSVRDGGTYSVKDGKEYVYWKIPSIKQGQTITLSFQVRVDVCVEKGMVITNTALMNYPSKYLHSSDKGRKKRKVSSNEVSVMVSESSGPVTPKNRLRTGQGGVNAGDNSDYAKGLLGLLIAGCIVLIITAKRIKGRQE